MLCVGFALVAVSKGYSAVLGLIAVASLIEDHGGLGCLVEGTWASVVVVHGFGSRGSQGSRAQAQSCYTGLVALWHVGSSCTRDQTHVSCIGRWILYHSATRKAQLMFFLTAATVSKTPDSTGPLSLSSPYLLLHDLQ